MNKDSSRSTREDEGHSPSRCSTPVFSDALNNQLTEMGDDGGMIVLLNQEETESYQEYTKSPYFSIASTSKDGADKVKQKGGANIIKAIKGGSMKEKREKALKIDRRSNVKWNMPISARKISTQSDRESKGSGKPTAERENTRKIKNVRKNSREMTPNRLCLSEKSSTRIVPLVVVSEEVDNIDSTSEVPISEKVIGDENPQNSIQSTSEKIQTANENNTKAVHQVQPEQLDTPRRYRRFYSVCEKIGTDYPIVPLSATTFSLSKEAGRSLVGIAGSSDFGSGLAEIFRRAGYHVLILSRNPLRAKDRLIAKEVPLSYCDDPLDDVNTVYPTNGKIEVTSYDIGLARVSLVFIALPSRHYSDLPLPQMMGKILVDVSNREPKHRREWFSNAEYLQQMAPSSIVIKSLNTLSAYALKQPTFLALKQNPTCGNEEWAVTAVINVLHSAGLPATKYGDLRNSNKIEGMSVSFFPEWNTAFPIVALVIFFYTILALFRNQLCDLFSNDIHWSPSVFDYFLIVNTYQVCGWSVLTLLSLTYLPGVLAGYIQLIKGTKYEVFCGFLDNWLKARKQIGLSALMLLYLHAICVLLTNSAASLKGSENTAWMTPTYMGIGAIGCLVLTMQGISSIPSISAELTWSESQFILSRVGWFAFLLSTAHVILKEWNELLNPNFKCTFLPSGSQISVFTAVVTIGMKLLLIIPCVDSALTKIRHGQERKPYRNPV